MALVKPVVRQLMMMDGTAKPPACSGSVRYTYILMIMIGALHNFSRSAGTAMMVAYDAKTARLFVLAEHAAYMLFKIVRRDFYYFIKVDGPLRTLLSFFERVSVKVIVDFSGCLHFRHPYELGGFAFSLSMVWAQAFPFVAASYYNSNSNNEIDSKVVWRFLLSSFLTWFVLSAAFLLTIRREYIKTFFGTQTAPEYTVSFFRGGEDDEVKWDAVFTNHLSYTKSIEEEVKAWCGEKLRKWKREKPAFFKIDKIPKEWLLEIENEDVQ